MKKYWMVLISLLIFISTFSKADILEGYYIIKGMSVSVVGSDKDDDKKNFEASLNSGDKIERDDSYVEVKKDEIIFYSEFDEERHPIVNQQINLGKTPYTLKIEHS